VSNLEGFTPELWTVTELPREPSPIEIWDSATQTLVADPAVCAKLDETLHSQIDREAGDFRRRFITSIPGQETTYSLKEKEALAWKAGAPETELPYLTNEAALRGISVDAQADLILGIAGQWRPLDVVVEGIRIGAKLAVTAATTLEAKEAAANIDWAALVA
jgi:hypothetical protein